MPLPPDGPDRAARQAVALMAANMRDILELTGVGIADLARRSEVSRETIYNILHHERSCSLATLARLAHALGVTPDRLLTPLPPEPTP